MNGQKGLSCCIQLFCNYSIVRMHNRKYLLVIGKYSVATDRLIFQCWQKQHNFSQNIFCFIFSAWYLCWWLGCNVMKDPLELELGVGSLLLHSTMIVPLLAATESGTNCWSVDIMGLLVNDYTGNLSPHSCDCLVCFIIILFYNGDIIFKYNPCQYSGKHSHSLSFYDPSI